MAMLFEVVGNSVKPTDEVILIPPFSEIWRRDKSKGKEQAIREFAYIEFVCSMLRSNPYRQFTEEQRKREVGKDIMGDADYRADELVQKGLDKYYDFLTRASASYNYFRAAQVATEKMQDFFMHFDLSQKNEKTKNPLYKPRDITSALNDTEKVLSNLKALEKKVVEELYEDTKVRAQKQISPFADPESL